MKKIFDTETVAAALVQSKYHTVLAEIPVNFFLTQYEKGELVTAPFLEEELCQVVVRGSLNIYFIRDDGERYSLASGGADYILGEMEFFSPSNNRAYTEAAEPLTCIAFPIEPNRAALRQNSGFLFLLGQSLSAKISAIGDMNAVPATLTERVLSYMRYKCENGTLKGLEQAAFLLHCSARQLQRILNRCVQEGTAKKVGKGAYRLIPDGPQKKT